ncbi:hypothetical protein [Streptomyces griseus]|uniref:hypothetical protein n=1 Tax=Streptomyces griseus TaxID=1911 RepID=UPI0036C5822F
MNGFTHWYQELDSQDKDIVHWHWCPPSSVPAGDDDPRYVLDWDHVRERSPHLRAELVHVLTTDRTVSQWMARVERDLQSPCMRQTLQYRHPWLDTRLGDESVVTVFELLCATHWRSFDSDSVWLCEDDLKECVAETVQVLALESGEEMSIHEAARLLAEEGARTPVERGALQEWLSFCGYSRDAQVLSLPPESTELPMPLEVGAGVGAAPDGLILAIRELTELLEKNKKIRERVTLGELLCRVDELDESSEGIAEAIRRLSSSTFVRNFGWVDDPQGAREHERVTTRTVTESSRFPRVRGGSFSEEGLAGCIAEVLQSGPMGLSLSQLQHELLLAVSPERVARILFEDSRFEIAANGAWSVSEEARGSSRVGVVVPAPGADNLTAAEKDVSSPVSAAQPRSKRATRGRPPSDPERLDKIASVFQAAAHPLALAEIKERAGVRVGLGYLQQQMDADPRFTRVQQKLWALTEWGLAPYKPIRELLSDLVDAHDGAVSVDEAIRLLHRDFGVKASSLRSAMSVHPFSTRGGMVRRLGRPGMGASPSRRSVDMGAEVQSDEAPDVDGLIKQMGLN